MKTANADRAFEPVLKRPPGRPRLRPRPTDPGILEALCDRLVAGESFRAICRDTSMPVADQVYAEMVRNPAFANAVDRAREHAQDALVDRMIDIAEDATPETVNLAKLQIWTMQWTAAKRKPKVYGDKLDIAVNHTLDLSGALDGARARLASVSPALIDVTPAPRETADRGAAIPRDVESEG